ncbi:MAG TPA: VCBS repeat-containing protein, partial [Gemmata sp.]|nr:VCBS repeat-containing protein [Gemmata sp.]
INSLAEYGFNCATYLHREIEAKTPVNLPVSLGSDDTLTVWLNGQKLVSENVTRACAPYQHRITLKLKAGTNTLLMKVCNGDGDYSFYFAAGEIEADSEPWFKDVSPDWGLGPDGLAHDVKGDSLAVADFNGDHKPDVLYGAGTGMLLINQNGKFVHKPDAGIAFKTGKVGPTLCDFNGDGHLDLFIPQTSGPSKLFQNDGTGKFKDVTPAAGDLAKPIPGAVSAAWGDFDNDGKPDLVVCCLKGCNRYFKNAGNGSFVEKTNDIGLAQKVFNSQAATFADLNGDGQLDLILVNEAQESSVLFGVARPGGSLTPLVVPLNGTAGLNGGKVVVKDAAGKAVASCAVAGADCRGGQCGLAPRFVLAPGAYRVEIVGTDGKVSGKNVTIANSPMQVKVN